jgi:hypothetical protein
MSNPESLCARVLKGKYYPQGYFMTATKKKNASHTWRAILAGRKVLEIGFIKRIGDGTSTKIWEDRLLSTGIRNKPICRRDRATATHVVDLLTEDGQAWNENALHQNLLPFDATAPQRIPFGRAQGDFWAWSREQLGLYTVRSSYCFLSETDMQSRAHIAGAPSYSVADHDPRWVKLWKQKVLPKVWVF